MSVCLRAIIPTSRWVRDFLRRFVTSVLNHPDECGALLDAFRFFVIPHTNPDGAFRNRTWRQAWGDDARGDCHGVFASCATGAPGAGRGVWFSGYAPRRTGRSHAWLGQHGPFVLHGSLHGMGISAGALLLIEKNWGYRAALLQERFRQAAQAEDLPLYDRNRQGEKGFFYLGPGFWTTPEGSAMRAFFEARSDKETAALFRSSSMEYVRSLGGDPLCYVTELPLFLVGDMPPGRGSQQVISALRLRIAQGEDVDEDYKAVGSSHPAARGGASDATAYVVRSAGAGRSRGRLKAPLTRCRRATGPDRPRRSWRKCPRSARRVRRDGFS